MTRRCLHFSFSSAICLAFTLLVPAVGAADNHGPASTLATVKSTGALVCGVIREEEDYSKSDTHGNRAQLDSDLCKLLGAAVLGDKAKVLFVTFPDEPAAIQGLNKGKVQVVATATPSYINKIAFHVGFSPTVFFDGQGFLVKKNSGITAAKDLDGKKVCFIDQTTNADYLPLYGEREHIHFVPFPFEEQGEMEAAMYTANCAAISTDVTQLANTRAHYGPRAKEFEILPQVITKDPLAVAYRADDAEWGKVVDWTVSAILQAEESGITAANAAQQRESAADPAVQLYFSKASRVGATLGLDADWAVRAVQSAGNYGEIYERDLGSGSPLHILRGMNALWDQGGLLYADPMKK